MTVAAETFGKASPGYSKLGDVVLSRLVERHEGAQEFGERSGHGDVVVRGTRRDRGLLRVEAREAEKHGPRREQNSVKRLPQTTIKADLVGQKVHVFDLIIEAGAHPGAHGHLGLGKLDFEHQVELRRQHLLAVEHADQVGSHEHVALLPGLHGQGPAAGVHGEPLPLAPLPPLVVFQQAVHEGRTAVVADVLDALAVRGVGGAAEHVAGAVQVPEGEGQLHRLAVEEVHSGGQGDAADP